MHVIDCKHCGTTWRLAPDGALHSPLAGCTFCRSDSGKEQLREALEMGLGRNVSAQLMSLAEARGDPLATQVGGEHYKTMKMQPVEFIEANQLPFLEGNVVKYVVRHAAKGGAQDLRKARHYIDLLLKLRYGEG